MNENKILSSEQSSEDVYEENIRPKLFKDYIGQSDVKENIKVFVEAAKMRDESLDHVLL